MPSDLQLSLCVPEYVENISISTVNEFADNVTQFFAKFPLKYEILFAVKSHQTVENSTMRTLSEKAPSARTVEMTGVSRAKVLERLFSESHGEIIVATSADLQIPLGAIFKMLQELYTEPEVQAVFGIRPSKKNSQQNSLPSDSLESFFHGVIHERTKWPFTDLFCPVFAIRKTAFEKIKPELHSSGHHWTLEVQRGILQAKLKAIEAPVFESTNSTRANLKGFARVREASKLLSFVLFRIRGDDLLK